MDKKLITIVFLLIGIIWISVFYLSLIIPKKYCIYNSAYRYCSFSKEDLTLFARLTTSGYENEYYFFRDYIENKSKDKTFNLTTFLNIEMKPINST